MSKYADENRPFIAVIKELPKMILKMGYSPIDPRIINSRTGVYMTILALFRLKEVSTDQDFVLYITGKIGKELQIDPYELLTPADYRTVSGTRKLEYRTNADSRAFAQINSFINDCKSINRELVNLSRKEDLPEKVEHIVEKATITFKRIVSLKEFSFGGAYLLDEDVYEHLNTFTEDLKKLSVLSSKDLYYSDLGKSVDEIGTLVKSSSKLESLKSEDFKKMVFKAHDGVVDLVNRVNKNIDAKMTGAKILNESIQFSGEFVKKAGKSGFDVTVFAFLPPALQKIKEGYDQDIKSLKARFNALYSDYKNKTPEQIQSKGNINPSHMKSTAKKYSATLSSFFRELDSFEILPHRTVFSSVFPAIDKLYADLTSNYKLNKSFKDSVDKSFKFKKQLKV